MADEKIDILKQRAIKLCQSEDDSQEILINLIKFKLNDEVYAFETKYLQEVIKKITITNVPLTPDFIKGIIVLRGKVYSINDLNSILNSTINSKESKEFSSKNSEVILIASLDDISFGFLCDDIYGEYLQKLEALQTSIASLKVENKEFLKGVFDDGTIFLNLEKILKDERFIIK